MKTKILMAIVTLAIVIPVVIIGGNLFYFAAAVVGLLGFRELMALKEKEKDIPMFIKLISVFSFLYLVLYNIKYTAIFLVEYKIVSLILFLLLIPLVIYHDNKKYNINDALFLIGSIFFLGFAFNYLLIVRNLSMNYFIYLLLVTTITDTFGLFTGSLIGKHKLIPSVSPLKTIEGAIGATFFGTFVGTVFYITVFDYSSIFVVILVTFILSIIAQIGDLVFSSIKRYYNTKDFSNLIPKHGGILDRLDSILFVLLTFSFLIEIL